MADQTQIQQLIQALTPSSVNNGNPNTIYNTSNGPVPTTNGNGDWYVPAVNPAANMNALMLQLGQWQPPTGGPGGIPYYGGSGGFRLPNPGGNFGGGWTPQPPVTNPTQPPGTGTGTPPAGGGGGGGGAVSGGTGNGYTWDTYGGGTSSDLISGFGEGGLVGMPGATSTGAAGGGFDLSSLFGGGNDFASSPGLWGLAGQPGTGNGNPLWQALDMISEPFLRGNFYNSQTGGLNLEGLGLNANGGMSWKQALDLIIPGNVYNSQTGNWNWNAIIGDLAGKGLGIPLVAQIMNALGAKQLDDNDPNNDNNFLARQVQDQRQNRLQNGMNGVMARTGNKFAKDLNAANLFGITPYATPDVAMRDIPTRTGRATVGDMINLATGQNMGGGDRSTAGAGNVSGWSGGGGSTISRATFNTGLGVSDAASNMPTASTNLSFRAADGSMNNGSGSSGAYGSHGAAGSSGVSGYGTGAHGADVVTGAAAQAMFSGLAAASDAAIKAEAAREYRRALR
jgi:hypothetical protein